LFIISVSKDLRYEDFLNDETLKRAVVRSLEIIGEAAKAISKELKDENSNIPLRAISDMRNVLAHQYFEVDHEKIELVVHGSLEDLKSTVIKILGGDLKRFC
jgi:uncharacterized protein with HEPN domain